MNESWSDDELEDREYPDDNSDSDDDFSELRECPMCGMETHEDAAVCPLCGEIFTCESRPLQGWSWWWLALGGAGVAATLYALLMF